MKVIRWIIAVILGLAGLFFLYAGITGAAEIDLTSGIILIVFGVGLMALAVFAVRGRKPKPKKDKPALKQNKDKPKVAEKPVKKAEPRAEDKKPAPQAQPKEKETPAVKAPTVPGFVALAIQPDEYEEDIEEITAIRYMQGDTKQLDATINHDARAFATLAEFIGELPIVVHESDIIMPLIRKYLPNYYPPVYDLYEEPFDIFDLEDEAGSLGLNCNSVADKCGVICASYIAHRRASYKPYIKAGCAYGETASRAAIVSTDDVLRQERGRVESSEFTDAESAYAAALRDIKTDSPTFVSKNNDYIVLRAPNHEVCRVNLNKTFTYVLVPEDWVTDDLYRADTAPCVGSVTNTDLSFGAYERVMISAPDQLAIFAEDIQDAVMCAQRVFDNLPLKWPVK